MFCQINQEIVKTSKNNQSSWKALRLMCTQLPRICCGHSKSCFIYSFVFKVISEKKNTVQQRFHKEFERDFHTKIIVTIIPTDQLEICFYSLFTLSQKLKARIKFSVRWWSGYFRFVFIASRALLQRYGEFNRLL